MAFEFRLETLLRIRKRLEEAAQLRLVSLVNRRDAVRNALEKERARLEEARQDMEERIRAGIMSDDFQFRWQQISHLEKRCRELAADVKQAEMDLAQGREELTRRHVERELVDNLRERDLRKYLEEVDRQLQKELDDIASLGYSRQRHTQG